MSGAEAWLDCRDGRPTEGFLQYRLHDHAFRFTPSDPAALRDLVGELGTTSLAFGGVQMEVSVDSGRCLFAWGFSPRQGWKTGRIEGLPEPKRGACFVSGAVLCPGVSLPIVAASELVALHDSESDLLWLHGREGDTSEKAVEVADGVVVLLATDDRPCGLLLHVELVGEKDL